MTQFTQPLAESEKAAKGAAWRHSWSVGAIIRMSALNGGFRVWRVVGVFLGGKNQEDVIELETLDRLDNTEGRMCIPREMLDRLREYEVTND